MKVGNAPQSITLNFYNVNLLTKYDASGTEQISNHSGKIILLSFINLNNQLYTSLPAYWDWLNKLEELRTAIETYRTANSITREFQILAVVQNFLSNNNLLQAVNALSSVPNYPVCRDANSVASIYRDEFLSANDNCFPSASSAAATLGNEIWSFLIDEEMIITDKWNNRCTVNIPKDPLSFHKMTTPSYTTPGSFDSTNFTNMKEFVTERIQNLLQSPTILSINPDESNVITSVGDISPLEIVFSKPIGSLSTDGFGYPMLDVTGIELNTNYTPDGVGGSLLSISGVDYNNSGLAVSEIDRLNIGAIENVATLTIGGSLADGTATITLEAPITDTAGVALADNDVSYTADLTAPTIESITSTTPNGSYKAAVTINIRVNFSEPVTLAGGNLNATLNTGAIVPVSAGSYPATQFNGTYTVSAGHNTADLNVTAIALSAGTLRDEAGWDADLSLPAGNNLGDNKNIVIDTIAPSGYNVSIDQPAIDASNETALSFAFASAEVGATYNYSIDDANGATPAVTGSGTILSANQQIMGINVSGLDDGTLTLTVHLTDGAGNQGANATDTVAKDTSAASIDVFVRDSLSDTGAEPSNGGCHSPDIIVSPAEEADPATAFSDVTIAYGTTNVEIGNDNYVYIRVLNNSASASDVTAELYYAYLGTTCAPDQWVLIQDNILINGVPAAAGAVPGQKISNAIVWNAPDPSAMGVGHFCLIAMVSNVTEAYPDNSGITSAGEYVQFIKDHNNVAYKNISFVNTGLGSSSGKSFKVNGLEKAFKTDILIDAKELKKEGIVAVKVNRKIILEGKPEFINMKEDMARRTAEYRWYNVDQAKTGIIRNLNVPAGVKYDSEIEVKLNKDAKEKIYNVPVFQQYNGKTMGSVHMAIKAMKLEKAAFIGVRSTHLVHRNGCKSLAKIKIDDLVPYSSLLEARTDGFDWSLDCLNKPFTIKDVSGRMRLKILKFFNEAKSPAELQRKVVDTLGLGYFKERYGVTYKEGMGLIEKTSREIIRQREILKGFTRLEQLDRVVGVGRDTFIDIVNSFKETSTAIEILRKIIRSTSKIQAKAKKTAKVEKKGKPAKPVKAKTAKAKAVMKKTVDKKAKPVKAEKTAKKAVGKKPVKAAKPVKTVKAKTPAKAKKLVVAKKTVKTAKAKNAVKPAKLVKVKKTVTKAKAKKHGKAKAPVKSVRFEKQVKAKKQTALKKAVKTAKAGKAVKAAKPVMKAKAKTLAKGKKPIKAKTAAKKSPRKK